jgi:hypothetical protein
MRSSLLSTRMLPLLATAAVTLLGTPVAADAAPRPPASPPPTPRGAQQFTLYDGSKVDLGPDGLGVRTDPKGHRHPFAMTLPQQQSALGQAPSPDRQAAIRRLTAPMRSGATGDVVVGLAAARVDGAAQGHGHRAAHTTDSRVNASLRTVNATSASPLFAASDPAVISGTARLYSVHVTGSAVKAAATLRATPGVVYAEADQYVSNEDTDPVPLPAWAQPPGPPPAATPSAADLPSNAGVRSSLQSYLNANGVDLMGGYADITSQLHQLPGQGEIITNVSLGDLTDQSMADNGDFYVSAFGPTTVVQNGQRYLDYPSLPIIPTYTVDPSGSLDPLGTVEHVDPNLGEVLLDFSMMAPLPHDQQRPGRVGSGATDLLGIAPGAQYRLVEPSQPTFANIATAMLAAARQLPHPDVITASLGFGTDSIGYPGRYLEDDPLMRSVVSTIVNQDGIPVVISSNDGTRLFTNAAVGPDGGSAPTDLPRPGTTPTSVGDDAMSTTPSAVPDSGAIDVGGTTTDDTVAVPPQAASPLSRNPTFAETRLDGATNFSSGFGTRVNVSAPSDNIPALVHTCFVFGSCQPSDAVTELAGGTSASAPMTAAAVADLLQVAKATGHSLSPRGVRDLLEKTGREVATQPQVDRQLHVGPQIDITGAVETLLGTSHHDASIVRMSTAHRVGIDVAGDAFVEETDPSAIDLTGPNDILGNPTGESLVGPLTFALDVRDLPTHRPVDYVLRVGATTWQSSTPSVRVTPAEVLAAAGLPLTSTGSRNVDVTMEVERGHHMLARTGETVTFGPTDGTHTLASAPVVAPVTPAGQPVSIHYDLTGVTHLNDPHLSISSIDHWNRVTAPVFRDAYSVPLTATAGTVTVPASVFAAGGGIYGATVQQDGQNIFSTGVAAPFRIAGSSARPDAPTLAPAGGVLGHAATVTRAAPRLQVRWDARSVPGATGAALEVSAPGPTINGLQNTFTNQFGTIRDANGVDSASTAWVSLPASAGTTTLDLLKLGIPTSLNYNVRAVATKHGKAVGQASGSSSLEFDDGLLPQGESVFDFDINPGGPSTVATVTTNSDGLPSSSSLTAYNPATGAYESDYAQDTTGQQIYAIYGSDPDPHRLLAASYPVFDTEQHLLGYDTGDHHQVFDQSVDLNSQFNIIAGRVDRQRHRTDLLAWRGGDSVDEVVPQATATGQLRNPVVADNGTPTPHFYTMLDIQRATGAVDLAGSLAFDTCLFRPAGFTSVNLDQASAAPMSPANSCLTGVTSDQAGHAVLTVGPILSFPILPVAQAQQADEATGAIGDPQPLGARSPIFPTVDTEHSLLIVGFLAGPDWLTNNNAMSAVGVYDLHTGAQLSFKEQFNLLDEFGGLGMQLGTLEGERGIQLDPATRTGWTFSPFDNQIQQFRY